SEKSATKLTKTPNTSAADETKDDNTDEDSDDDLELSTQQQIVMDITGGVGPAFVIHHSTISNIKALVNAYHEAFDLNEKERNKYTLLLVGGVSRDNYTYNIIMEEIAGGMIDLGHWRCVGLYNFRVNLAGSIRNC